MRFNDPRRLSPRISVVGTCGVASEHDLHPAEMVDLSSMGIRLERRFDRTNARRTVQLEIALPDVDEVVWASGHVTFAHLSPMGGRDETGQPHLWCRAGIQLDAAARRDLRLLREYVFEIRRARQLAADETRRESLLAMLA